MKSLYLDIITRLNSISTIGHKDLYKGQVNDITSIPDFPDSPCAFIEFPYTYYRDVSAKVQHGHMLVRVILGFDPGALTGTDVTDVFDLKDEVYSKVQGLHNPDKNYSPLTRGGERTETKYAGIYLFELDFYTTIQDTGVYLKNHTNINTTPPFGFELDVENT